MKLTEALYAGVIDLWREATEKAFVMEMAKGTLDERLFRNYMIQDYLYLLDYIDTLKFMQKQTEDTKLADLLQRVITGTENETYRIHLPQMKQMGVSDEDIAGTVKLPVITEYLGYMRTQTMENGIIAGLTALLQCSWLYAYIGEIMASEHSVEIEESPYKFWFDAYTRKEYVIANQRWKDVLDSEAKEISSDISSLLVGIFRTCAGHENELWDALYT